MTTEQLKKLRIKEPLRLFDTANKMFVTIQFNKKETKFVCWQRFHSLDRRNWVKQNDYLSLKDVDQILNSIKEKKKTNLSIVII